jgi:hypothetical protein
LRIVCQSRPLEFDQSVNPPLARRSEMSWRRTRQCFNRIQVRHFGTLRNSPLAPVARGGNPFGRESVSGNAGGYHQQFHRMSRQRMTAVANRARGLPCQAGAVVETTESERVAIIAEEGRNGRKASVMGSGACDARVATVEDDAGCYGPLAPYWGPVVLVVNPSTRSSIYL